MNKSAGVFFLFALVLSSVSEKANSNLVSDLCNHSYDPNLCLSSIQARLDSGDFASTTNQIEIVAISAASANASATSAYIKEKLSRKDLDPATEDVLDDCLKNYQDAVEQFEDSISAMLVNGHVEVDVWLQAAISAIETCGDALESRAGNDEVLMKRNDIFLKLCQNALVINKMLT